MRAKNKKEFEEKWNNEIDTLYSLAHSLPCSEDTLIFLEKIKELRKYVKKASEHTFNKKGEYKTEA